MISGISINPSLRYRSAQRQQRQQQPKRRRNHQAKKQGNQHKPNRVKRWFVECAKRNNKLKSLLNQPEAPKMAFDDLLLEKMGARRTRTWPRIYWAPNQKEQAKITGRTGAEWQNIVATATEDSGKQATVRFKTIPEFEEAGEPMTQANRKLFANSAIPGSGRRDETTSTSDRKNNTH